MKAIKILAFLLISNSLIAQCDTQSITINQGWNLISTYIIPDTPNVVNVFGDIVSDIHLVKNRWGRVYVPYFGINGIGDWQITQGYKVKATSNTTLTMCGDQVNPATTPIPLPEGWSMISYLRTSPMNISTVMNAISPDILLVKNNAGEAYIPSFGINTIGNMLPGKGYTIKMVQADTLVYSP